MSVRYPSIHGLYRFLCFNLAAQIVIKYVDLWAAWAAADERHGRLGRVYPPVWQHGPAVRDHLVFPFLDRVGTAVFWTQVAVTLACYRFCTASASVMPDRESTALPRAGSAWVSVLLAAAYVAVVAIEPGTFFARRPTSISRAMQVLEGILNVFVIYASWQSARFGATLADVIGSSPAASIPLATRRTVAAAAAAPFWGFSAYFFVSQLVSNNGLTNDEAVAMLGALICYVLPHYWVLRKCRQLWSNDFRVGLVLKNPFGPHVEPLEHGRE